MCLRCQIPWRGKRMLFSIHGIISALKLLPPLFFSGSCCRERCFRRGCHWFSSLCSSPRRVVIRSVASFVERAYQTPSDVEPAGLVSHQKLPLQFWDDAFSCMEIIKRLVRKARSLLQTTGVPQQLFIRRSGLGSSIGVVVESFSI